MQEINPDLPAWLCTLISHLMAKEPGIARRRPRKWPRSFSAASHTCSSRPWFLCPTPRIGY